MKKLITLLLVLALLVPMCLVANAAVEEKPFYGVTWSGNIDGFTHLENLYTISISMLGSNAKLGSLMYGSYTDEDVTAMAEKMKKDLNARPEGQRYIHFFGPSNAMELVENVVYMDTVVEQLKDMTSALFAKYYAIGGKVDGAMMSMLYTDMGAYYINQKVSKDQKIYNKIVKDERYATQIRPLLAERGFVFYDENVTAYTPEIYGISGKAGSKYAKCQAIWDTVMKIRLNDAITQWAYEPMAKYFPDVRVSDYQSTDTDAWMKPVNNDGDVMGSGGNGSRAGNTSCENFYSGRPTNDFFKSSGVPVYKSMPTYMGTVYEKTSFNNFRYDMNIAKQVYAADKENEACFWVSRYSTATDNNTEIANTPYYTEQVYHLCLYDPEPFVVFINTESVTGDALNESAGIADKLLAEVSRVAGYADREPIAMPVDWNSEFVISGMYANGRNIWRITPNRDLTTKEAFKVAGSDPTFSLNGQTITFPGGKIIEDTAISETGTLGYWVETPKNVTPVIASDADRFEKYPAYREDFESYKEGSKLLSTNIRDLGGWTVQPKGSDMLIVKSGSSQALSVTGDSLLENKLIPANVTVGDEYAKKQSWEITITVPAGIAEDAKLTLLNYDADMDGVDGGFMLQGGKLYYGTGETDEEFEPVYEALMDIAPGTYTLRRDLNFGQTFYCSYSVISGGKVVKTAEKVAIPAFTGKVKTVGIACDNMNQRVILDDYTLQATSAAADLYLYDTALGLKLDKDAKQTKSTTYRLSWANASAKNETATVKADITSGGKTTTKTLKSVTLKPGYDGVEYGTVELKAGETVKVYLETSIKDEKVDLNPTAPTGQTEATKQTQATSATKTTSATKATTPAETKSPTKATQPASSRITRATKATQPAQTEATKPTATKATTPVETKSPTKATQSVAQPTEVTETTQATEVTTATEITEMTEATEATDATQATDATDATEVTDATRTPMEPHHPDAPKSGPDMWVIVVIAVVILAAAGTAVYFFVIKKKK